MYGLRKRGWHLRLTKGVFGCTISFVEWTEQSRALVLQDLDSVTPSYEESPSTAGRDNG